MLFLQAVLTHAHNAAHPVQCNDIIKRRDPAGGGGNSRHRINRVAITNYVGTYGLSEHTTGCTVVVQIVLQYRVGENRFRFHDRKNRVHNANYLDVRRFIIAVVDTGTKKKKKRLIFLSER